MVRKKKNAGLSWVGDGRFSIPGIPTRDLTPEEANEFRSEIEAAQKNTGQVLYVPTSPTGDIEPEETGSEGVE
jgi:hypothetical protein